MFIAFKHSLLIVYGKLSDCLVLGRQETRLLFPSL